MKDSLKGMGMNGVLPEEALDELVESTFKDLRKFQSGSLIEDDNVITFE